MPKLTIDNRVVEVPVGTSVLEAALCHGIYIPHLCHHPDLPELGSCRLCLVEVDGGAPEPSCTREAVDGLVIRTKSEQISQLRRLAMELLLAAHPEECTACPKYGRCEFQTLIQYMDVTGARMSKRAKKTPPVESPLIQHEMLRCVLCGRCVRACADLRGVSVLTYRKNGQETYISTANGQPLTEENCRFCGACAEVCPTGAIRDIVSFDATEKRSKLLPCADTCPAHVDIPRYIRLAGAGNYSGAAAVLREKLPFPGSLGHVCNHKCESVCRRNELGGAVSIREIKRHSVENDTTQLWKTRAKQSQPTGKTVAIVGGGPAGLTAAIYLRKNGHAVTVYEKQPKLGGQLQYGIPAYRLPRELVDREIGYAGELGMTIKTGEAIEQPACLLDTHDAVLVAVGTHAGVRLPIPGCDLPGVLLNTDFLRTAAMDSDTGMGRRVCVLGGGNVAFDCARTAKRLGAEEVIVACLETRAHMPADEEEITDGEAEGVNILAGCGFERVEGVEKTEGMRLFRLKSFSFDETGRAVIEREENSAFSVPCDTVIFAVGQRTGLDSSCGLPLHKNGTVTTLSNSCATDATGVFACGDALTGTRSVVEAIASAREAASEIDKFLGGNGDISEVLAGIEPHNPHIGCIEGFSKLTRTSTENGEANRCLQCDLRFDIAAPRVWTDKASPERLHGKTLMVKGVQCGNAEQVRQPASHTCAVQMALDEISIARTQCGGESLFCREGLYQIEAILTGLTKPGQSADKLALAVEIAEAMCVSAGCDLGKNAAMSLLDAVREHKDEFEAHCKKSVCPTGECAAFRVAFIDPKLCEGCGDCIDVCPASCIEGKKGYISMIDEFDCTKCGKCAEACPSGAAQMLTPGARLPKLPDTLTKVGRFKR